MILDKDFDLILVDRVLNDLKRGLPVIVSNEKTEVLVASPDTMLSDTYQQLQNYCKNLDLILTKRRSAFLWKKNFSYNQKIFCKNLSLDEILSIVTDMNYHPKDTSTDAIPFHDDVLILTELSELLPSLIIANGFLQKHKENLLTITINQIKDYVCSVDNQVKELCSTKLKLKSSTGIIKIFRSLYAGKDHYAIIINGKKCTDVSETPLVRIHSSCFTGDLLNSITCDCHDQLHAAIKQMSEQNGGIIIYLNQEGRGIGLANKIRAYNIQAAGFDTVEGNEMLGFSDCQRNFTPAISILKHLKITKIKLLTNNPKKANSLEKSGIKIEKCVSHLVNINQEAQEYIKTKALKMHHKVN